ncbi:MAG: NADH-quinone oxidoreductase subunit M, partial [Thermoplasmata archaeon]|nr:NADH-quinone oxidoreductase subunit M [Thermoplasmata archaeon]
PDAHVEAPTAASVILAGVLLKMGGYGLIRFGIQLMPEATTYFMPLMAVIGVVSMIYGAMLCLAQTDFKRMVAYSSVSHMGLVLLGIATMTINGLSGAIFQMFAHGLVSGGLFMMAGILLHKTGTRDIRVLRGLAPKVPILAVALITLSLASLGLPGLISFITEVLIFVGTYEAFGYWVFIPLIALVLTAAYYLWMLQKVAFGPYNKKLGDIHDLYNYELIPVAVLIFLIVLFGIYPGPVINMVTAFAGGIV